MVSCATLRCLSRAVESEGDIAEVQTAGKLFCRRQKGFCRSGNRWVHEGKRERAEV
jgi:hypothetical protein